MRGDSRLPSPNGSRRGRELGSSSGTAPSFVSTRGSARTDLRARARALGRENLPATGWSQPTEFEASIIREFECQHIELGEAARVELQNLSATFISVEAQLPDQRDLARAVVDAAADVDRELGTAWALVSLWSCREQRLRDLRIFAREHRLARDARYPASRWLHLGVLAVLVLLESWANAAYFSEASDFGLIGGFVRACGISVLNVVTGFAAGRFLLPGLVYRRQEIRILASLGLALLVTLAILFNLALAGYRDVLASGVASEPSIRDLLHDPLHRSFLSIALFGTGLLAWCLALWKGYVADDGHPFYGSMDRRFHTADRAFVRARDALVARVITRVRRVPAECQFILGKGYSVLDRLDAVVTEAHRVREPYETERQDLCTRCTIQLRAWREENCFIRTDPAPAYFSEYPPFATLVPEPLVGELAARAQSARSAQAGLGAQACRVLAENEGRLTNALERVERHVADLMTHAERTQ